MKTGNFSGTQANAYTSLIPFELGTSDKSLLNTSSMSGPESDGRANVMCLTCHRAHASPYEDMLRWDYTAMIAGSADSGDYNTGCFACHTGKDGDS